MTPIPFPDMAFPLVAILRGLKPQETESIVGALIETGFRAIEIPLNSPIPSPRSGLPPAWRPPIA